MPKGCFLNIFRPRYRICNSGKWSVFMWWYSSVITRLTCSLLCGRSLLYFIDAVLIHSLAVRPYYAERKKISNNKRERGGEEESMKSWGLHNSWRQERFSSTPHVPHTAWHRWERVAKFCSSSIWLKFRSINIYLDDTTRIRIHGTSVLI